MAKFDVHKALRKAKDSKEIDMDLVDWIDDNGLSAENFSEAWDKVHDAMYAVKNMAKALLPPGWHIRVKDAIGYVIENEARTLQILVRFRQMEDIINDDDAKAAMLAYITDERWKSLQGEFDWLLTAEKGKV